MEEASLDNLDNLALRGLEDHLVTQALQDSQVLLVMQVNLVEMEKEVLLDFQVHLAHLGSQAHQAFLWKWLSW